MAMFCSLLMEPLSEHLVQLLVLAYSLAFALDVSIAGLNLTKLFFLLNLIAIGGNTNTQLRGNILAFLSLFQLVECCNFLLQCHILPFSAFS